jgi:molecular chaperone DnaK
LSVSAKDKLSGKEQAIRITPSSGLSPQEIEQMVVDAKRHFEDDQTARDLTELRNRISGQMASTSRSYSEFGRFLDSVEQEMVKNSIQRARDVAPIEDDISTLQDILSQLENSAQKLTAAMFSSPGGEGKPEGSDEEDPDVRQLLKSALDDVKS